MSEWILSWKPGFSTELMALQSRYRDQVLEKLRILESDPHPDGHAKKKLRHLGGKLHRLRSGDFRVFYTFDDTHVSVLKLSRRSDDTYDDVGEDEFLGGGTMSEVGDLQRSDVAWVKYLQPAEEPTTPLPESISEALLQALDVPVGLWPRLLKITTQEDLLSCPGVADEFLLAIDRHMFEMPIELLDSQPTLVAPSGVDDLLRYTEGELVGFLLRLNPEQEKFVSWATTANGPTLVKGGPGTGKSTVAIYRTREMIRVLRGSGVEQPRILFTTYTKALVKMSQALLDSLLGEDASCVDVRTADSVIASTLGSNGFSWKQPDAPTKRACETAALINAKYSSNVLKGEAQKRAIEKLGRSYVFEEIATVIQARGLRSVDDYLAAPRPGRRIPLDEGRRRAVWAVAQAYAERLEDAGRMTWQQGRAEAARLAADAHSTSPHYDGVVIDEAQDLDPSALAFFAEICAAPNRLFLTADANQSIYAAGFSWSAVHEDLKFVGRTGVLRANHRSTQEITEGARSHLNFGIDEDEAVETQTYVHTGGAMPAQRAVSSLKEEADLISSFIRGATRDLRLTIGSAAVLVPNQSVGNKLASQLQDLGIAAGYHKGRELALDENQVTLLSLLSAKGLEFPVVAVAGLRDSRWPHMEDDWDRGMELEALTKARRQLFVAMTRAMRALLVVTPEGDNSMLFDGFDPTLWNVGQTK